MTTTTSGNEIAARTLALWAAKTAREAYAHNKAGRRNSRLHYYIGIPTVIVSSVVATTVFASLGTNVALWTKFVVGAISVVAAVLTGLQTFFNCGGRAEQHRLVQIELERIGYDIDLASVHQRADEETLAKLGDRLTEAQRKAPSPRTRDYLHDAPASAARSPSTPAGSAKS